MVCMTSGKHSKDMAGEHIEEVTMGSQRLDDTGSGGACRRLEVRCKEREWHRERIQRYN